MGPLFIDELCPLDVPIREQAPSTVTTVDPLHSFAPNTSAPTSGPNPAHYDFTQKEYGPLDLMTQPCSCPPSSQNFGTLWGPTHKSKLMTYKATKILPFFDMGQVLAFLSTKEIFKTPKKKTHFENIQQSPTIFKIQDDDSWFT